MASFTNLAAELRHIAKLATSQVEAAIPSNEIAECHYDVITKRLRLLKNGSYEDVTYLTKSINEVSPLVGWTSQQKRALVMAATEALRPATRGAGGAVLRKENQVCTTFELYLTADENAALRDPSKSDRAHIQVVKVRAQRLGLLCPSEATKGRMAQIINHLAHNGDLVGASWMKLLRTLKDAFKPLAKHPWKFEHLATYPQDPSDLPKDIFGHSYTDDAPALTDIPNLECPEFLRKSSKKISPASTQAVASVEPRGSTTKASPACSAIRSRACWTPIDRNISFRTRLPHL